MSPLPFALFGSINGLEILIVVTAVLVLFGARGPGILFRLARQVGRR